MNNNKQNSVDKDFVPYEQSLALKEFGFKELCMSSRDMNNTEGLIQIPTFSQAFRFFRDKHNLIGGIQYMGGLKPETTWWDIYVVGHFNTSILAMTMKYQPYEEAELELLKKLIEIVTKR
jgi:hypothetical protein